MFFRKLFRCDTSYLESVILKATHYLNNRLHDMEKRIMSSIADVNAALDSLGTSLSDQLTAITDEIAQLAAAGGATPDQLQTVVDRIASFKAGVDQTIASLRADDPVPPAPPAPVIDSLNPSSGSVGTAVTILGSNFGDGSELVVVLFNGTVASVTEQTVTSIVAIVPDGATSGPITVETVGGQSAVSADFTVE